MESLRLIYKILKYLEKATTVEHPDFSPIRAEALGIPQCQWLRLLRMLVDNGYITGVQILRMLDEETIAETFSPEITLDGLIYLSENSVMRKISNATKGILPFIKP